MPFVASGLEHGRDGFGEVRFGERLLDEARVEPAKEWFDLLEAPEKRWYSLPDAGHSVAFEQADELHRILLEDVRPA